MSASRFLKRHRPGEPERPLLDLSGPILARSLESLVQGTEAQGGVEQWTDALQLKSRMFRQALQPVLDSGNAADLPLDGFKSLCAFMASVRRRVGPYLEQPAYGEMAAAIAVLLDGMSDTTTTDQRMAAFCGRFPQDRKHRWVRDLAAEILHNLDPERFPLMCRWVWDRQANTGVIREIWFDDNVDNMTIDLADGYGTFLMLREELSQYLSDNGVFRDVMWYVDLLSAKIYADYIAAQGGVYLRADFSAPGDPMEHVRRLLGLDGVRAGPGGKSRSRLKAITGEAIVIDETKLMD